MSWVEKNCDVCATSRTITVCDDCRTPLEGMDDAVTIQVALPESYGPRAVLHYCRPCAVTNLPAAVGVGPGSDLPASNDPPEKP